MRHNGVRKNLDLVSVSIEFRKPFDLLADLGTALKWKHPHSDEEMGVRPVWLLDLDSNQEPFD
jgi:hypothetical protein